MNFVNWGRLYSDNLFESWGKNGAGGNIYSGIRTVESVDTMLDITCAQKAHYTLYYLYGTYVDARAYNNLMDLIYKLGHIFYDLYLDSTEVASNTLHRVIDDAEGKLDSICAHRCINHLHFYIEGLLYLMDTYTSYIFATPDLPFIQLKVNDVGELISLKFNECHDDWLVNASVYGTEEYWNMMSHALKLLSLVTYHGALVYGKLVEPENECCPNRLEGNYLIVKDGESLYISTSEAGSDTTMSVPPHLFNMEKTLYMDKARLHGYQLNNL